MKTAPQIDLKRVGEIKSSSSRRRGRVNHSELQLESKGSLHEFKGLKELKAMF